MTAGDLGVLDITLHLLFSITPDGLPRFSILNHFVLELVTIFKVKHWSTTRIKALCELNVWSQIFLLMSMTLEEPGNFELDIFIGISRGCFEDHLTTWQNLLKIPAIKSLGPCWPKQSLIPCSVACLFCSRSQSYVLGFVYSSDSPGRNPDVWLYSPSSLPMD